MQFQNEHYSRINACNIGCKELLSNYIFSRSMEAASTENRSAPPNSRIAHRIVISQRNREVDQAGFMLGYQLETRQPDGSCRDPPLH